MSLAGDGESPEQGAVVRAVPLANQLEQGGFRFVPLCEKAFGHAPELALPELRVRYEYAFESAYEGPVHLVMEPGSIVGNWILYVNRAGPLTEVDFGPTTAHVRGSLGVAITDSLERGRNTICVEVVTARPDGGLLNPLYLAGDFGVALDPVRLLPRGNRGMFERYEANLLPYYAGVIEYVTEFLLDHIPEGGDVIVELDYDLPFHEATEISINGGPYRPVLWQPRCVRVSADCLRVGTNVLNTKVYTIYTTLIRPFEGQWFDDIRHEYRNVGELEDGL
jgi:hypothetical protein